ncbi:MAG: hypothetical protein ABIT01_08045 [Thermoanaerobaculia bacterium]
MKLIRFAVYALCGAFIAGRAHSAEPLRVDIQPSGPDAKDLRAVPARILRLPEVVALVGKDRVRVVSVQLLPEAGRCQATVFDYATNHAFTVDTSIRDGEKSGKTIIRSFAGQPLPNDEEFEEAVNLLRNSPDFGKELGLGALVPFKPMPPLLDTVDGVNRIVNVGLSVADGSVATRIVGVDLVKAELVNYKGGVPENSRAAGTLAGCGNPSAGGSNGRGLAGQMDVTITRGPTTLWQFTVLRPSISSGVSGSGAEFRNIRYKGKLILTRAHTPILNVKYVNDACGPYRDWQYAEHDFNAPGCTGNTSGVCATTSMPTTMLESGNDAGNFRGVAFYNDTVSTVTFETELTAGWYRYVPKWTFKDDGTIQARMGFAGTNNSCICNIHLHNAFFRLDFDVDGASNTVISRKNQGGWQPVATETWGRRDRLGALAFQLSNPLTGDKVQVTPGPYDAIADSFGVGDFWVLQSKPTTEIDDGISCVSCSTAPVQLTNFVNGESVQNTKVVIYYGAHFLHNINDAESANEIVGPDITFLSW